MQLFKNILIPVDLTANTETAVKKGLELADGETRIHLLHVKEEISVFSLVSLIKRIAKDKQRLSDTDILLQLNKWKQTISGYKDVNSVVVKVVASRSVQQAIIEQATKIAADLIVIAKSSSHAVMPFLNTVVPGKIPAQTASVVLTVKPGGLHDRIKTILVPVTDESAFNKAALLQVICKRFPVKVHLLAVGNYDIDKPAFSSSVLLQLYQKLKANLHCQIELAILRKSNSPKAILKYAEKINADILLLHSRDEINAGWPNRYTSDMVPAASKLQVWAV